MAAFNCDIPGASTGAWYKNKWSRKKNKLQDPYVHSFTNKAQVENVVIKTAEFINRYILYTSIILH